MPKSYQIKLLLISLLLLSALTLPTLTQAVIDQTAVCGTNAPNQGICFPNPSDVPGFATQDTTLVDLITRFLKIALWFLGFIALIFVVYGGFRYLTAGGDEEKVKSGKAIITNALIGLVIIVLAYALVAIVYNLVRTEPPDISNNSGQRDNTDNNGNIRRFCASPPCPSTMGPGSGSRKDK